MFVQQRNVVAIRIGIRRGTVFTDGPDGELIVGHHWGIQGMRGVPAGISAQLERLVDEPAETPVDPTIAGFATKFPFLVVRTFQVDGVPQLRLEPIGEAARPAAVTLAGTTTLRLSRFACLRRLDDELVLESPLALYRAALLTTGLTEVVAALARPRAVAELIDEHKVNEHVLAALVGAGLLDSTSTTEFSDDTDPALRTWTFHDLLFHSRSRSGRHDRPVGTTYPFGKDTPWPPVVKPSGAGDVVRLFRPDLAAVAARDASFTKVLEARRSVRCYGPRGMSADQLGEFLYRTLRVRGRAGPQPPDLPHEISSRPYPGGGACYELEVYVVANRCQGLPRGIYHYDPLRHELRVLYGQGRELNALYGSYRRVLPAAPDVLFVVTCRFQRLSLKYDSIAYGIALRDVGALYQTMYLTATSMGLAACALGDGDSEVAARVLGLDFTEESAIGEFVLGSMPAVLKNG